MAMHGGPPNRWLQQRQSKAKAGKSSTKGKQAPAEGTSTGTITSKTHCPCQRGQKDIGDGRAKPTKQSRRAFASRFGRQTSARKLARHGGWHASKQFWQNTQGEPAAANGGAWASVDSRFP